MCPCHTFYSPCDLPSNGWHVDGVMCVTAACIKNPLDDGELESKNQRQNECGCFISFDAFITDSMFRRDKRGGKTRRVCEKDGTANVKYKNISEKRRRYVYDIYTTLVDSS